jgi:hypothetical protein
VEAKGVAVGILLRVVHIQTSVRFLSGDCLGRQLPNLGAQTFNSRVVPPTPSISDDVLLEGGELPERAEAIFNRSEDFEGVDRLRGPD